MRAGEGRRATEERNGKVSAALRHGTVAAGRTVRVRAFGRPDAWCGASGRSGAAGVRRLSATPSRRRFPGPHSTRWLRRTAHNVRQRARHRPGFPLLTRTKYAAPRTVNAGVARRNPPQARPPGRGGRRDPAGVVRERPPARPPFEGTLRRGSGPTRVGSPFRRRPAAAGSCRPVRAGGTRGGGARQRMRRPSPEPARSRPPKPALRPRAARTGCGRWPSWWPAGRLGDGVPRAGPAAPRHRTSAVHPLASPFSPDRQPPPDVSDSPSARIGNPEAHA